MCLSYNVSANYKVKGCWGWPFAKPSICYIEWSPEEIPNYFHYAPHVFVLLGFKYNTQIGSKMILFTFLKNSEGDTKTQFTVTSFTIPV